MKIVQGDEVPLKRGLEHRGGTFHGRIMVEGTPGRPDNFQLNYGQIGGDFYSPRHHHNFEQVRFVLEGAVDFARDGKLTEGMVGYFPEGAYYGPQSQDPAIQPIVIVLQCGGASGQGYLSQAEVKAGMAELAVNGEFKDGVYRRKPGVAGKRNTDGYQAIWEHVNGRPMTYPRPRYNRPFFMDPANYDWLPVAGAKGVAEKKLGSFTERGTTATFYRLDAGAALTAEGRAVYFVARGTGKAGDTAYRRLTTVFIDAGETCRLAADAETVILRYGLPDLAGMRSPVPAEMGAAAE
jgi:hypothetical protein